MSATSLTTIFLLFLCLTSWQSAQADETQQMATRMEEMMDEMEDTMGMMPAPSRRPLPPGVIIINGEACREGPVGSFSAKNFQSCSRLRRRQRSATPSSMPTPRRRSSRRTRRRRTRTRPSSFPRTSATPNQASPMPTPMMDSAPMSPSSSAGLPPGVSTVGGRLCREGPVRSFRTRGLTSCRRQRRRLRRRQRSGGRRMTRRPTPTRSPVVPMEDSPMQTPTMDSAPMSSSSSADLPPGVSIVGGRRCREGPVSGFRSKGLTSCRRLRRRLRRRQGDACF